MLANFSVAGELCDLVSNYVKLHSIHLPKLTPLLNKDYPDGRMPITDWWQALELLREHTQLPHIGIELGKLAEPGHAGALGYLVQASASVAEALQAFQKYQAILYEGAASSATLDGDQIRIEWPLDYGYSTRESDDTLTAGLVSFLRHATGQYDLGPSAVGFVYDKPVDTQPYRDCFGCDVKFGLNCTFMTFPVAYTQYPMLKADPMLNGILKEKVEHQLAQRPQTEVFLRCFYQHLLLAMQAGEPTVETVARRMLMSPRTLFRRLEERDLHFKDALLETRRQLAEQYLLEKRFSHSDIAERLGYSEQSAFSRAFKSWTGQTPSQFQK